MAKKKGGKKGKDKGGKGKDSGKGKSKGKDKSSDAASEKNEPSDKSGDQEEVRYNKSEQMDAETMVNESFEGFMEGVAQFQEAQDYAQKMKTDRDQIKHKLIELKVKWQLKENNYLDLLEKDKGEEDLSVVEKLKEEIDTINKVVKEGKDKEQDYKKQIANLKARVMFTTDRPYSEGQDFEKAYRRTLDQKNYYMEKMEIYKAQLTETQEIGKRCKDDCDAQKRTIEDREAQLEKLTTDYESKELEHASEKERRFRVERDYVEQKIKSDTLQAEINSLTETITRKDGDYEVLETRHKGLWKEFEVLTSDMMALDTKLNKLETQVDHLNSRLNAATNQNERHLRDLDIKEREMTGTKENFKRISLAYRDLTKKFNTSEDQRQSITNQFYTQNTLFRGLKREFEKLFKSFDTTRRSLMESEREKESMRTELTKNNLSIKRNMLEMESLRLDKKGLKLEISGLHNVIFKLRRENEDFNNARNDAWMVNADLIAKIDSVRSNLENSLRKEGDLAKKVREVELAKKQVQMKIAKITNERNLLALAARKAGDELYYNKEKTDFIIQKLVEVKEDKAQQDLELLRKSRYLARALRDSHKLGEALSKEQAKSANARKLLKENMYKNENYIKKLILCHSIITALRNRVEKLYATKKSVGEVLANKVQEGGLYEDKFQVTTNCLKRMKDAISVKDKDIDILKREVRHLAHVVKCNTGQQDIIIKLRHKIVSYEREVISLKTKTAAYEREMGRKFNFHRWNVLQDTDPGRFEQNLKNNFLRICFNNRLDKIGALTLQLKRCQYIIVKLRNKLLLVRPAPYIAVERKLLWMKQSSQTDELSRLRAENSALRSRLKLIEFNYTKVTFKNSFLMSDDELARKYSYKLQKPMSKNSIMEKLEQPTRPKTIHTTTITEEMDEMQEEIMAFNFSAEGETVFNDMNEFNEVNGAFFNDSATQLEIELTANTSETQQK